MQIYPPTASESIKISRDWNVSWLQKQQHTTEFSVFKSKVWQAIKTRRNCNWPFPIALASLLVGLEQLVIFLFFFVFFFKPRCQRVTFLLFVARHNFTGTATFADFIFRPKLRKKQNCSHILAFNSEGAGRVWFSVILCRALKIWRCNAVNVVMINQRINFSP